MLFINMEFIENRNLLKYLKKIINIEMEEGYYKFGFSNVHT